MKKKWTIKRGVCAAAAILALAGALLAAYLFFSPRFFKQYEPSPASQETTVSQIQTLDTLKRTLKLFPKVRAAALKGRAAELDYGTCVVPGLDGTETLEYSVNGTSAVCTSMVPQGLAVSKEYLFISAYCYTGTHNSVIYVMDRNTHEFLKELVIRNRSHVGGLAYDSVHDNLWVACMENGIPQVNALSLLQIENYRFQEEYQPIAYTQSYNLYAITRNSFLTYANNSLYVGYYTSNSSSVLEEYELNEDGTLLTQTAGDSSGISLPVDSLTPIALPSDTRVIQSKAQGVAFYKNQLLLSRSYGVLPSSLQVYTNTLRKLLEDDNMKQEIWFPEKMEQICVDGDDLYVLFESGAFAYRYTSWTRVDRVLKLNLNTLLES